jgi:prepilin-type N-terminal cleavage/methylation domain-containing protein
MTGHTRNNTVLKINFCFSSDNKGFSLVELSIVLVILGLLTGGILTGQSLIKAAELRAVSTEFSAFQTAFNTFKNKYFQLPGDFSEATLFWGKLSAYCNAHTGTAQTTGVCNGDGNGILAESTGANNDSERFMIWAHLSRAQMLNGNYTGISGSGAVDHAIASQNVPASKFSNSAWCFNGTNGPSGTEFDLEEYGNLLEFGRIVGNDDSDSPALTPEEAWNIDKKIDDAKPGMGKVVALRWNDCTDATSNTDLTSDYLLDEKDVVCALMFPSAMK